jgi:hypothetical protein
VVRVSQHQHAADLSSLVQHADDHVAVLAHDEMAYWSGAFGEHRGAKPSGA